MLWFAVTVANEGRAKAPLHGLKLEVLEPPIDDRLRYYGLLSWESIGMAQDKQGNPTPTFQIDEELEDPEIEPHGARMFLVAIPANGGYDEWKKVRLTVDAVGVEPATTEVEWNLWWSPRPRRIRR